MARVRSKHSNLLNYFICDKRDLSPAYVRSCEKFFKSLELQAGGRPRATSNKLRKYLTPTKSYVKR